MFCFQNIQCAALDALASPEVSLCQRNWLEFHYSTWGLRSLRATKPLPWKGSEGGASGAPAPQCCLGDQMCIVAVEVGLALAGLSGTFCRWAAAGPLNAGPRSTWWGLEGLSRDRRRSLVGLGGRRERRGLCFPAVNRYGIGVARIRQLPPPPPPSTQVSVLGRRVLRGRSSNSFQLQSGVQGQVEICADTF